MCLQRFAWFMVTLLKLSHCVVSWCLQLTETRVQWLITMPPVADSETQRHSWFSGQHIEMLQTQVKHLFITETNNRKILIFCSSMKCKTLKAGARCSWEYLSVIWADTCVKVVWAWLQWLVTWPNEETFFSLYSNDFTVTISRPCSSFHSCLKCFSFN